LPLPGKLAATVRIPIEPETEAETEPAEKEYAEATQDVSVTWAATPEYNADAPGEYVFVATVEGDYALAASTPTITVTVEGGAPTPTVEPEPTPVPSESPSPTEEPEPTPVPSDSPSPTSSGVTITIAAGEYGSALYLDAGKPVTDEALLDGVSAVDGSGNPVPVTVADVDGLNLGNPQSKGEPGNPLPYTITYTAEGAEDVTRECYVTLTAPTLFAIEIAAVDASGMTINGDKANTTIVSFGSNGTNQPPFYRWYVIGLDGEGVASEQGTITLFSVEDQFMSDSFDPSGASNVYFNSLLRKLLTDTP
jgi:hypothetical protein